MSGPDELPDELADAAAERLLAVTGSHRAAALAELVGAHPRYGDALRRLCAELGGAERLLDTTWRDRTAIDDMHIGGHRVIRRLGEGAFGVVFLCAQERPVAREVAVKVMRPGAGDARTLQRFAAERQLLASLNHPAITQVFDAGELPDGRPFFVMEHVDGVPLRTFCEQRALSCPARLRLFADVCRGVAHAHSRGVVHRDLKPANVLVVDSADGPRPKIIDFGIAKVLTASDAGGEPRTDAGRVIGTPGYMSPEQATGRAAETDERADVWALGVMLYELLTGELPWPTTTAVHTGDPSRPSLRVATARTPAIANAATATSRRQLAAELRGDLDWITLKALAHDRAERYPTATALLHDVERHLRGEPVSVGPPSASYRLRKLARRHRGAFAWATACAVTLVLAVAIVLGLQDRLERSGESRLQTVRNAVTHLHRRAARASTDGAPDRVVRALLDEALALHDQELTTVRAGDDNGLRLELLAKLATSCWLLGDYRQAIRFGEEACRTAGDAGASAAAGSSLVACAIAMREVGRSHFQLREHEAARTASSRAVEMFARLHEREPLVHSMNLAGTLVEYAAACGRAGAPDEQLAAHRRGLDVLRTFAAARPEDEEAQRNLVRWHCGLATMMLGRGQHDEAEAALREAERLLAASPLVTDEERALVPFRLARLHAAGGRPRAAVAAAEQALQFTEAVLRRNPDRLQQRTNRIQLLALLCEQCRALDDDAAAARHGDAIVATPAAEVASDRVMMADTLVDLAHQAVEDRTAVAVFGAGPWLARCLELLATIDDERARTIRTRASVLAAGAAAERGRPWPALQVEAIARSAAATLPEWAPEAWLQAARSHLAVLDLAGARTCLAAAAPAAGRSSSLEQTGQAMRVAIGAEDARAALACAHTLATAATATAQVRATAAIGAWHVTMQAERSGDGDLADEARELVRDVCHRLAGASTDDGDLASNQARVCRLLLGEPVPADEFAAAVRELDAQRDRSLASHWSEPLWFAAHLAGANGRPDAETLRELASRARAPFDDVQIAELCLDPNRRAAAGGLALPVLRQALANGLCDRSLLRARRGLTALADDAGFVALLETASAAHGR